MKYALTQTIQYPETPYAIACSTDGKFLGATCFDQKLRVYDTTTMGELKAIHLGTSFPHACAFTPDTSSVASGGKSMRFFELDKFKCTHTLKGHRDEVHGLALSSDGAFAVTCSGANVMGADCSVRTFDTKTLKERSRWKLSDTVFGVALSPDDKLAVAVTQDGKILAGTPGAKAPSWTVNWTSWLYTVAFSLHGKEIWVGGDPHALAVFSAEDGKMLRTVTTEGGTRQVIVLPDGNVAVGVQHYQGQHQGHVVVFDAQGHMLWSSDTIARMIHGIAASPDGSVLYAIASDPNILVVFEREK